MMETNILVQTNLVNKGNPTQPRETIHKAETLKKDLEIFVEHKEEVATRRSLLV